MKIESAFEIVHLQGAMVLGSSQQAGGTCFYRSAALVLDLDFSELCIGTLPGVTEEAFMADRKKSPTHFIHCWVECCDSLFSPVSIEKDGYRLVSQDRNEYYELNEVRDVRRLLRWEVETLAHDNRWSYHFCTGQPFEDDALVRTLLAAVQIPYKITSRGGIVPKGTTVPRYAR